MFTQTTLAPPISRRTFLESSAIALASGAIISPARNLFAQEKGDRPSRTDGVTVLNPTGRVPLSFIIDDSTCLVNLAHFAIPQFAQVFPDQYRQPWKTLPREMVHCARAGSHPGGR